MTPIDPSGETPSTHSDPEVMIFSKPIPYAEALALQEKTVSEILSGNRGETIIILEHEPVYTIGRMRDQSSLKAPSSLRHPVIETNRGGQATYHGPGQLTGYPIFDLNHRGRDLHLHLRLIEDALIAACSDLGVNAGRRDGLTGVWVEDRKLASIGVGVRKWISMHGFAINVTPDCLPPFLAITPCGLNGVRMTCLDAESTSTIDIQTATSVIIRHLKHCFS